MSFIETGQRQIADARSQGRFSGAEAEPRQGLKSGHMPGAKCVHYASLLNDDGTMKAADEILQVFAAAGIDVNAPVMTTCGSGVTAAILNLALGLTGHQDVVLYDGSWSEWGGLDGAPIEATA